MSENFRIRKHHRNGAIAGMALFGGMMIFSLMLIPVSLPERRPFAFLLVGFFEIFFTAFFLRAAWLLHAYQRDTLVVDGNRITHTGLFRIVSMDLREATKVRWLGLKVVLRDPACKLTIDLDKYEPPERRALIRLVRRSTPVAVQRDWERFCHEVALRLWQEPSAWRLRPWEMLLTRRHLDRLCLWFAVATAAVSTLMAWLLGSPGFFLALAAPVVLWPILRIGVPAQGMPAVRIDRKSLTLLALSALWFAAVGEVALYGAIDHCPVHANLWGVGCLVAWVCLLFVSLHRQDRRWFAARQAQWPSDAEEWERLEAAAEGEADVSERESP
jgi:hypothetical protein